MLHHHTSQVQVCMCSVHTRTGFAGARKQNIATLSSRVKANPDRLQVAETPGWRIFWNLVFFSEKVADKTEKTDTINEQTSIQDEQTANKQTTRIRPIINLEGLRTSILFCDYLSTYPFCHIDFDPVFHDYLSTYWYPFCFESFTLSGGGELFALHLDVLWHY